MLMVNVCHMWHTHFKNTTHLLNKTFSLLSPSFLTLHQLLNSVCLCCSLSPPFSLPPSSPRSPRAQEVFRQAMRSPVVRLEVVPSSNRERYEKSLIGQLFGDGVGPDNSPRAARTKEPPPPVKAKPAFKPSENPASRLAEEAATMEAAVSVSCLLVQDDL